MLIEKKFQEFMKFVSENNLPLEAISVCDEEKVLCEMHFAPNFPRNIYSHTKSFVVSGIGVAVAEGKISLEDKVVDLLADKVPENPDPRLEKIRLKDFLCMSSGFGQPLLMNKMRRSGMGAPDYEKFMLSQPVKEDPGARFCYSSADSIMALHMTERAIGMRFGEYLYEHILKPMDMGWPLWEHDPQGHANGGGGMYLTCTEMMKLGQLYLADGMWKGTRLLESSWIKEVSTPRFTFEKQENNPWLVGYGYQFWMSPYEDSYRADGAFGQITTILPRKGLVVSFQCPENGHFERVRKAVHEEFLTQL